MGEIFHRPDLGEPTDHQVVGVVVQAIDEIASQYNDGLTRDARWLAGVRETAPFAVALAVKALREAGVLSSVIDLQIVEAQVQEIIPIYRRGQ